MQFIGLKLNKKPEEVPFYQQLIKTNKMKTITITQDEIKTATDAIKWHLKKLWSYYKLGKPIKEYGATRLADIIYKLKKQGYTIHTTEIAKTTRFGRKTTIAKYL